MLGLRSLLELLHTGWTERYGHFEHGYLVLALSVWMAVRYWRRSPPNRLVPETWAILPLLLCIAALALLELVYVNSARLSLLPLIALAAVTLVLGRQAATRLFWPIVFVYLALPQWWAINGVMQALTTSIVTHMVGWTAVPAFIQGNFVNVPAGVFEIASGCSGLNYLLVGVTLSSFYALMYLDRWKHRIALVMIAVGLALISNWIRVYSLILIGHLSDMRHYLITVEHHRFGWLIFMIFMGPMLLIARRMENSENAATETPTKASAGDDDALALALDTRVARRTVIHVAPSILPAALAAALILMMPRTFDANTIAEVYPPGSLLPKLAGHAVVDLGPSNWRPIFVNAINDQVRIEDGLGTIEVYRAVYPKQDRDHHLGHARNNFLGDSFLLAEQAAREVDMPAGKLRVSIYQGSLFGEQRQIWAWYRVAGDLVATPFEAKLAELRGLFEQRRDGVAFAVSTFCQDDCAIAEERLASFLAGQGEGLLRSFDAVADPPAGSNP